MFKKIEESNFKSKDYEEIKNFIFWEFIFSSKEYYDEITNNKFIGWLFNLVEAKESDVIFQLLGKIENPFTISNFSYFIAKHLNLENVAKFINLYDWTENQNLIFYVYDILKQENKKEVLRAFKENEKLSKKIDERDEYWKKNKEKRTRRKGK